MTTLDAAARSADSALAVERMKLSELRQQEEKLSGRLDHIRQEAQERLDRLQQEAQEVRDRLQQETQEVTTALSEAGRAAHTQEQRIAKVEQAMAEQAERVVQMMGELDMKPATFEAPVTNPDPLGLGAVPLTEQPKGYIQQVDENGAPPSPNMTQPVAAVVFEGDPNRRQELPGNVGEVADRTGGRPNPGVQEPKGRGRRG